VIDQLRIVGQPCRQWTRGDKTFNFVTNTISLISFLYDIGAYQQFNGDQLI